MDGTILVADDDRTIRTVLTQALTRAGCRVHATSSLTTLMRWIGEGMGDVVITDVKMPDGDGLEMLPKIARDRPGMPVIVISAQNTIMTAIRAEEADAFDYLPKPFDLPDILKRTARALKQGARSGVVRQGVRDSAEDLPLIGQTPAMQALYRVVARVMNADLPLLVTGESGTGKTLLARIIHDHSDRRTLPLLSVGQADLDEADGPARILARARGGTVLLDEIGDLGADAQARIVRMMDAPGDDAPRFIATRADGQTPEPGPPPLRDDLYYRIAGAVLAIPPLRARNDDIPLLARHFMAQVGDAGPGPERIAPQALDGLRRYRWPGNVRQFENTLRRLCLTAQGEEIGLAEVDEALGLQPDFNPAGTGAMDESLAQSVAGHLQRYFDMHGAILPPSGLHQRILREVETPLIEIAMNATGGNQAKCAELLGLNRNTLRKKISTLDIRVTRRRKLV